MTRLIYVPVVHSIAEMGSAGHAYQAAFVARYGERKLEERTAEFDAIWRAIGEAIRRLRLDLRRVNLYQDSLPVCGHERALVHEMAIQGSRNHQLLEALADSGASLIGTSRPRSCSTNIGSSSPPNAPRRRRLPCLTPGTTSSPVESTRHSAMA